ncbi:MAG TPA: hypothetical protein DCM40_45425 [Maribacter sp.]|nr:hypothetical protein [Maribacter sp.]|tara:strand:+ start:193 stop:468 length:276 start_codon:yes stop_codon:yes gene_type:complete
MSETKKFTEAELKEITELRNANAQKINEFGQIELEILLTNQRLDVLAETKQNLENQYIELQAKEKDLVTKLNEKYGTGTVDLESGEFIPRT